MKIRQLLFWELHILAVLAVFGLLAWRYWYAPCVVKDRIKAGHARQQSVPQIDPAIDPVVTADGKDEKPVTAVPKPACSTGEFTNIKLEQAR